MKNNPTTPQRLTVMFAALLATAITASVPATAAERSSPARFEVGCCAYTFRHLTAFEAIEKTKECGGDVIEFFLWQKLSPEHPKVVLDMNLSDEHIAALKAKLKATGVKAVNAYFNNAPFQDKAGAEAGLRKLFGFARKLGLRGLTGEPPAGQLDLVEKMVKEYEVQLCFHNHPKNPNKPDYQNWDPKYLLSLMAKRDPRMGFSVDTGHLARSGVDSVEAIKLLDGRVLSVHLKDVKEAKHDSMDLPYGGGITNIKGVLAELKRQGFRGHVGVEYEHSTDRLMDDVKFCINFIRSQEAPNLRQDEWGAPAVSVVRRGNDWLIAGQRHKVVLSARNLGITVQAGTANWKMLPSAADDLTLRGPEGVFPLRLTDAAGVEISSYETGFKSGVKIRLSRFQHKGRELDLDIQLFVCLEGKEEDLVFDVVPTEKTVAIERLLWPKGFEPKTVDFTVVPTARGMLLPRDWPKKVSLYSRGFCWGRGLYMPWWGCLQGQAAALVIIETPVDSGCQFGHPPGGPTSAGVRWENSLGRLAYPRCARICFLDKGSYVDVAKRYRRYAIETGRFVSLREKIARNPVLAKLVGALCVALDILHNVRPSSSQYDQHNPAKNYHYQTFDARAQHLRRLAEKLNPLGLKHVYVHLDAWGFRGYGLNPDNLPPCPEAGGWEGMRRFADTCDALGYVLALHDQYGDYYLDAKSYNERHARLYANGERPFSSEWAGGAQNSLCPRLQPGHVRKNYRAILAHGVKVRGAYLDCFTAVVPEECYSPEHPATREDSIKSRIECLEFIRNTVGVASSEEVADWAIPHMDMAHWVACFDLPAAGHEGLVVPLFSLVYHDALLVPWPLRYNKMDCYMDGLVNGGLPYMSLDPSSEELDRVRTMCSLHQRVGLLEMTNHEFLDQNRRKQRSTFADGTTVTIDLDANSFQIVPGLHSQTTNRTPTAVK